MFQCNIDTNTGNVSLVMSIPYWDAGNVEHILDVTLAANDLKILSSSVDALFLNMADESLVSLFVLIKRALRQKELTWIGETFPSSVTNRTEEEFIQMLHDHGVVQRGKQIKLI